jgi:DNA polymerase III epsilon subunit family exonuclease
VKWRETTLFCIDTETSGIDSQRDRIVELGACLVGAPSVCPSCAGIGTRSFPAGRSGRPVVESCKACGSTGEQREIQRFGTLVNPGMPIPREASEVNGITDEMVAGKPALEDVAEAFLRRVVKAEVLVGYNWPFDELFLSAALGERWAEATDGKPVLDSLVLVRLPQVGKFWPGKGRHKLEAVARKLGVRRRGQAHRASSDAELTVRILLKLGERLVPKHLSEDAHEASAQIERWREAQDQEFQAWLAAQPERATA